MVAKKKATAKKIHVKDIEITVGQLAEIMNISRQAATVWSKEDGSPFAKKGGISKARIQDVMLWIKTRFNGNSIDELPPKEERNLDYLEELLWKDRIHGKGPTRVKADSELREILKARGDGLPDIITVRLAVMEPEDQVKETDIIIDSVHNLKPVEQES